jgi:hypothetical protein
MNLKEDVEEIRNKAFAGCSSLREITIANKNIFIDMNVFEGCRSLSHIKIEQTKDLRVKFIKILGHRNFHYSKYSKSVVISTTFINFKRVMRIVLSIIAILGIIALYIFF